MVPGTSLAESMRLGRQVSGALLANPQLASVAQQVGRAELADDTWGVNYSEIQVELKPCNGKGVEEVEEQMRRTVARFPGAYFAIHTFLNERIEEIISGTIGEVVIKVFGDDLDLVDRKAREIARVVERVRGATDVQLEAQASAPRIVVRLRPERLRQFGFRPVEVLEAVDTAYQGSVVAQAYEASRVFDVSVILEDGVRRNPEAVGELVLAQRCRHPHPPARTGRASTRTRGASPSCTTATRRRQAVTCNVVRARAGRLHRGSRAAGECESSALPAGVYCRFHRRRRKRASRHSGRS